MVYFEKHLTALIVGNKETLDEKRFVFGLLTIKRKVKGSRKLETVFAHVKWNEDWGWDWPSRSVVADAIMEKLPPTEKLFRLEVIEAGPSSQGTKALSVGPTPLATRGRTVRF